MRTFRDGVRILLMIAQLVEQERPLRLFTAIAVLLWVASFLLAAPLFKTYMEIGTVPRFPTAILCSGIALIGALSQCAAIILGNIVTARREGKRMAYLAYPRFDTMQSMSLRRAQFTARL
jgi:hypothetical protein